MPSRVIADALRPVFEAPEVSVSVTARRRFPLHVPRTRIRDSKGLARGGWPKPARRLPPSNRALRQYLQAWDHAAAWRRGRRAVNRPSPAYHAARTMAVDHFQWRGPRCYNGPDWSRSDPLVEYGIGLPFGGQRSWTRPRNEFCSPRAGVRIPQPSLENERSKLANVTNRGRDNRCRDG